MHALPVLNTHANDAAELTDEQIEAMRPRTYGDCLRDGWGQEANPELGVRAIQRIAGALGNK